MKLDYSTGLLRAVFVQTTGQLNYCWLYIEISDPASVVCRYHYGGWRTLCSILGSTRLCCVVGSTKLYWVVVSARLCCVHVRHGRAGYFKVKAIFKSIILQKLMSSQVKYLAQFFFSRCMCQVNFFGQQNFKAICLVNCQTKNVLQFNFQLSSQLSDAAMPIKVLIWVKT